jgi:hypothetical protein
VDKHGRIGTLQLICKQVLLIYRILTALSNFVFQVFGVEWASKHIIPQVCYNLSNILARAQLSLMLAQGKCSVITAMIFSTTLVCGAASMQPRQASP